MSENRQFTVSLRSFELFLKVIRILGTFAVAIILFFVFVKPFRFIPACGISILLMAYIAAECFLTWKQEVDRDLLRHTPSAFDNHEKENRDVY